MTQENENKTVFQEFTNSGLRIARNVGVIYNDIKTKEPLDKPISYDSIKIKDMTSPNSKPIKVDDELISILKKVTSKKD